MGEKRHAEGRDLVVTGPWSDANLSLLDKKGPDGLHVNYAREYQERGFDFIEDPPIRRLSLIARTIGNLDPVYDSADHLDSPRVTAGARAKLDVGRFLQLTSLFTQWQVFADTIHRGKRIEDLYLGSSSRRLFARVGVGPTLSVGHHWPVG